MITATIPYNFVKNRTDLGWREIRFGLDHQLIAPKVAIERAVDILVAEKSPSRDEVELASLSENESVRDLVFRLAEGVPPRSDDELKDKWLYLVLAWVFQIRESIADPLVLLEEIYSDFEYPAEMASFVRYMPMQGPDLRNQEQNEARLFDNWKDYLNNARERFAPKRNG